MSSKMNRREMLAATAGTFVAAVTGCDSTKTTPTTPAKPAVKLDPAQIAAHYQAKANANDEKNLYNLLNRYSLTDQNGQPVNITALKTSLKDRFTTLTFGFGTCTEFCPMINNRLGKLGDANPNLTSIVISVNPADNASQASRDAMIAKLRSEGMKQNIVLLFPQSQELATQMAADTGVTTNPRQPLNHSMNIILHAPGGTELRRKKGTDPESSFPTEWAPIMSGKGVTP